jgi:hypothetical protein
VVMVVTVVLVNPVPLRADEAPLAAKGLLATTPLPGVALVRRGQRHTLCIRIRVRYGFGVRRGGFPTVMMAYASYRLVVASIAVGRSGSSRG